MQQKNNLVSINMIHIRDQEAMVIVMEWLDWDLENGQYTWNCSVNIPYAYANLRLIIWMEITKMLTFRAVVMSHESFLPCWSDSNGVDTKIVLAFSFGFQSCIFDFLDEFLRPLWKSGHSYSPEESSIRISTVSDFIGRHVVQELSWLDNLIPYIFDRKLRRIHIKALVIDIFILQDFLLILEDLLQKG